MRRQKELKSGQAVHGHTLVFWTNSLARSFCGPKASPILERSGAYVRP